MTSTERDHRELHDEQKRTVPLSLLADDQRETHRNVYVFRPPRVDVPIPEPPRAA